MNIILRFTFNYYSFLNFNCGKLFYRYGLLGPSGCGKTTLLHSIVGRCEIDAGEIEVKAKKKSKIGYMPQVRKFS